MIPYGRQSISDEDIQAVVDVLRSDFITQGPAIERFEHAVGSYCGAQHAVAVANGTAALHLACLAADLGHGDVLWTSPNSFVASANCARYCGASVDFVDIDPVTLNMSPAALEAKLVDAEAAGALPKVVVPVDFGGLSCDMRRMRELADRFGFIIIEDASHAIGGTYRGAPVGSCEYADMTTFSFHPVKIVTTGEGGMVTTNDDGLADRLRTLRTHGITRDESLMKGQADGPWYYQQIELGYNFRMTDIQAALGTSQMGRIDGFVERRNEIARAYDNAFADLPIRPQGRLEEARSAFHLYVIRVDASYRARVFAELREAGVGVNVHYIPIHLQPYYRELGFAPGDFPEAEAYYSEAITLPMWPGMTDGDLSRVVDATVNAIG